MRRQQNVVALRDVLAAAKQVARRREQGVRREAQRRASFGFAQDKLGSRPTE